MEIYNYHERKSENQSWSLMHIDVLLKESNTHHNVSFILYACLECRNLLEKIEFDLLMMSIDENEKLDIINKIKGKTGILNANKEFKTLTYRLQSFSECISKISDLPVKAFDFKKADSIQKGLSEYLHIYTRTPEELSYESEFIQEGKRRIEETLSFINSYFVKQGNGNNFGVLNFKTLRGGKFHDEFLKWKNSVDTDTESLYKRLKKINDEFYNGAKANLID